MTAQLSDRADSIREFATHVSHELKTPITGIRGAAELLREQWPEMTEAERARFLTNIDQGAARMQRLVSRLLHLARIQSEPEPVEEIELADFLASLAGSYGEQVRLELGAGPGRLRMHVDHLESALRNLLDNAVRHGGGRPVDIEAERLGERVRFRVRDRGAGVRPGIRRQIFERFFTTEREAGGTGLGLSIVRAVAETRGGSLGFETGPGGTCFELVL